MSQIRQRYLVVKPETIRPHPENANRGDVNSIAESIEENGFYGAVLVQKGSGRILAGEHRWRAALQNSEPTIPILEVDCDDEAALKILLADNATAERATRDEDAVGRILAQLSSARGTGYEPSAVERMMESFHRLEPVALPVEPNHGAADDLPDDDLYVDIEGDFDGQEDDDDPDEMEPEIDPRSDTEPAPNREHHDDDRFPLAIVLGGGDKRRWDEFKKSVGVNNDKRAFLQLLAAAMNKDG